MSFRHLVLGLVSTTLVASTLSVQAATPAKPAAKSDASEVVKSITGGSKQAPSAKPAATTANPAIPNSAATSKPAVGSNATAKAVAAAKAAEDADDTDYKPGPSLPTAKYSARASAVDPYSWGVSAEVLTALRQSSKLQTAKGTKAVVAKNNKAAEKVLLSILARIDAAEKPNAANQALVIRALAKYYQSAKNNPEALAYANRLLQIDKERFGERNLFVAEDMKLLGDLYSADESYDDAAKTYTKALKMVNKSPDSQYCPNIKYAAANKNRKQILISSLYDGLAVANFQPPDPDEDDDDGTAAAAADAYFTKAVREILKSSDYVDKYNRANLLFSRYKQYLKKSDQPDKAAQADEQIEDYERRIQADREYRIQQSTKL